MDDFGYNGKKKNNGRYNRYLITCKKRKKDMYDTLDAYPFANIAAGNYYDAGDRSGFAADHW